MLDEDGWLRTGDIADDRRGRLHHDHRPQEGHHRHRRRQERRAAEPRERPQDSRYVSQALVVGDRRPYIAALITLDELELAKWRDEGGEDVDELVQGVVDGVNAHRSRYEQIKRFEILPRDFSADEDEITPTLKLRRRVVQEHFADAIERLVRVREPSTCRRSATAVAATLGSGTV